MFVNIGSLMFRYSTYPQTLANFSLAYITPSPYRSSVSRRSWKGNVRLVQNQMENFKLSTELKFNGCNIAQMLAIGHSLIRYPPSLLSMMPTTRRGQILPPNSTSRYDDLYIDVTVPYS